MRRAWLWLLLLPAAEAAVDGVVLNRTTGRPQPGAIVTLYQLGDQGMQPVQTVRSDAAGRFQIAATPQGPHLLQTIHAGVLYNQMLQPGANTSGLTLDVYDASADPAIARVTQHMILVEAMGGVLHVSESIIFQNSSKQAYNDARNGTLRFYLPPGAQAAPQVNVTAPQGMPVERPAVKTGRDGVYKVEYPVKPGETRFDLTYVIPEQEPRVLSGRILHNGGPVRIVVPQGITLAGDNIRPIGEEPSTHATVYEVDSREYSVTVQGAGSLRAPEPARGGGSGIQQIRPPIYDNIYAILGLALAILLLGLLLLYRRGQLPPSIARGRSQRDNRR